MKAFGIVIFSHNLSRISSPEFGLAIALTIIAISVLTVRDTLSIVSAATETEKTKCCFCYSIPNLK